jgi:succinate-semialdehyde dehydrogenase/glutarate-semialdehyde dehydrogenase
MSMLSDQELLKSNAYINGEFVSAEDSTTFAVKNPSTGEVVANVAKCGAN